MTDLAIVVAVLAFFGGMATGLGMALAASAIGKRMRGQ